MLKAYQSSGTPVSKSQEDIRKILSKYRADGVQFSEDWKKMMLYVRFLYAIRDIPYTILFKVPIPKSEGKTLRGRKQSASQIQKVQAQYERGVWRAVFWAIKSRMEAVEFGIETFQEAFLSHFEIPGTDKQIGDVLIPRLETGNLKLLGHE